MRIISEELLIDNELIDFIKNIYLVDNSMDIYLHNAAGETNVKGGVYGEQVISTFAMDISDLYFYKSVLADLDLTLDINLNLVNESAEADISFFYDTEIKVNGETDILGIVVQNNLEERSSYEVFLNYPNFDENVSYLRYAFLHELGHVLGLEHPFNNDDGDVFENITSPWTSAYPEETVMAYRQPSLGSWPQYFSDNDLNALKSIWGIETEINVNKYIIDHSYAFEEIKDFDGFYHGIKHKLNKTEYAFKGKADVNLDGYEEYIFVNHNTNRLASVGIEEDFLKYGENGNTRVLGIYIDPLVAAGEILKGSENDSQRRFSNDIKIDNLVLKSSGDFNFDGLQELYWKTVDGTSFLRLLMHEDGNIQYANYQNADQMNEYLITHGHVGIISDII